MLRALLLLALLALLPAGAVAQTTPATLIADSITVQGNDVLVAKGSVEVLYGGARLKAESITYDRTTDRLTIEGPMTIVTDDGTFLLADSAALAPDLSEGILRSARLVLDQQVQLAAAALYRVDGRYSVLEKTLASSCRICVTGSPPLWQIRARRIVHDEWERQLYFDNARLEIAGIPVVYLPRLRLPDPTLKRASGFLVPKIRVTDGLGTGIKVPYFFTIGRHADLTVTPYFSTGRTRTVELRFRRAFRKGDVEINGAASRDDILSGQTRSYLFADGHFDLPRDFNLDFRIESVSDPAYLLDYGYSEADRLASSVEVSRTRRNEYIRAGAIYYNSLRASESNQTLPTTVTRANWQRRFVLPILGGMAGAELDALAFNRRSGADVTGRDVARVSGRFDWRRDWTTRQGFVLAAQGALTMDHYTVGDDSTATSPEARTASYAAVELRWPLVRSDARGASHVLEPVVQLVWSGDNNASVTNEDSLSVEFDEGNLFSLNRFPGADGFEQGLRANLGVSWTRFDPAGWSLGATVGRILRQNSTSAFASGSGLDGTTSDWLAAVRFSTAGNLEVSNRAVFDDSFAFTRDEMRLDWNDDKLGLSSTFIWQEANLQENRATDSSEWVVDASYRMHRNWTGKADWRYDFVTETTSRAGVGLEYRSECVVVDLSLSRRFTSSTSVRPTTDFGLTIALTGFGNRAGDQGYSRSCAR